MKFLIIRLDGIGEILLATPIVRCLKQQSPLSEVHYLVRPEFKMAIETNPFVDTVHELGLDDRMIIQKLQDEKFDAVIDLQNDASSHKIQKALKTPSYRYERLSLQKFIFKRLKWNVMPRHLHLVDRYMDALESFEVKNDGAGLDYSIPKDQEVTEKDIPASHQLGYIAIIIETDWFTKKLPLSKMQELCAAIDHPVMLTGRRKEFEEADKISSVDPIKIYNACGKFSFHETGDLIRKSKLVISYDTGLVQIAAALKKPILTIWGSTTPSFGVTPYYGENYLADHPKPYDDVQVHKLWCRPCTEVGRNRCPQGHFKCMKNISIEEIIRNVNKRLSLHSHSSKGFN